MPYSPVALENFGGLNLVDDPATIGWSNAVDLLNVDFDASGRLRSRWGTTKLNAIAAASTLISSIGVLPGSSAATTYIISGRADGSLVAYDATGTQIAIGVAMGNTPFQYAAIGTGTTGPFLYIAWSGGTVRRFDGAAFTAPAGMPSAFALAVSSTSNRLVASDAGNRSRVKFSDAGAPETWTATSFVDLHPNDGQKVRALASWRDLVFAFKDYKFFVFYGETTDASGNPIFNYRLIDAGQGIGSFSGTQIPVCAAPDALYFANRQGVWRTTGGNPEKVSGVLDPMFLEETLPFFTAFSGFPAVNSMTYHAGRVFVAIGDANHAMLVYTIATGTWSIWSTTATPFFSNLTTLKIGNTERLVYTTDSGDGFFRYFTPTATTDDGTAITSRYRSGFSDLGTPLRKRVREWILEGTGSPTLKTSFDFGSLETGAAVTLGVAPAVVEQRRRYAVRGRQFSFQVGASTAWSLNNLVANVDERRAPGTHS